MKWITHETVALGGAFLLGMPPEGLAGVFVGSILPDVLDQGLARLLIFRRQAFRWVHRGATHWFGWWLALFAALLMQTRSFADASGSSVPALTLFALGLGFGALMHVLLDMCTNTGVPVAPWTRKRMMSLKLCTTGSVREYTFLALFVLCFAFIARHEVPEFGNELNRQKARLENLFHRQFRPF